MVVQKTSRPTGRRWRRAIVANPDGPFAVTSCSARLHDDKPALAVMFSDSVDTDLALDKLIEVNDLGDPKRKGQRPHRPVPLQNRKP